MQTALRQYLVILAIAMWLGGFTFYAVVVVPTGAEVLGGSDEQGFVTQVVTRHLNWIALVALVILLGNVIVERGTALTATWLGMLLAQAALFWMHSVLDQRLDPQTHGIADDFHFLHEAYLWVSAVQWLLGLAHIWFVLAGWRNGRGSS
jgi:uncharacterized membrane protein